VVHPTRARRASVERKSFITLFLSVRPGRDRGADRQLWFHHDTASKEAIGINVAEGMTGTLSRAPVD
jgi:hypothetical protein